MAIARSIKLAFLRKTFPVELPDKYTYPTWSGFEMPGEDVLISAIMKYADSNRETVEFLSVGKPILFRLNNKDIYEATLRLGRTRMRSGYYLHCSQVID